MSQFENVSSPRGAPMGRPEIVTTHWAIVKVFKVKMVDGDYDDGGAYWGGGPGTQPLYCCEGHNEDGDIRLFTRADSLDEAREAFKARYPGLTYVVDPDEEFLDRMTEGFIECMCWAESGGPESTLGEFADPGMLTEKAEAACREACADFIHFCTEVGISLPDVPLRPDQIGHDFWFTLQGHGAGFWDRGMGDLGERLTDVAKTFSYEAWVEDDEIHFS